MYAGVQPSSRPSSEDTLRSLVKFCTSVALERTEAGEKRCGGSMRHERGHIGRYLHGQGLKGSAFSGLSESGPLDAAIIDMLLLHAVLRALRGCVDIFRFEV